MVKMGDLPFKVLSIDHVGLVPQHPDVAINLFELLGIERLADETVHVQKVDVSVFQVTPNFRLEILKPIDGTSPISNFLVKRRGGIHHIAVKVDDIKKALSYLAEKSIDLIDSTPKIGLHGSKTAFIHPHSCGGILVELVEHSS